MLSTDDNGNPLGAQPSYDGAETSVHGQVGSFPTAFALVPVGVTPHFISSSDNTTPLGRPRSGNTAVKRKNESGPTAMADATRSTGTLMANQMKDMSDASLQVERSKVEVQLKLFEEQMTYQ